MADVTTFLGGPGTGKTRHLTASLQKERDQNGLGLNDFMFVSFTRSQRDDVRRRIKGIYPEATSGDIDNAVRTFHGAALYSCKQAGIIDTQNFGIITESRDAPIYRDFCKQNGIHYDGRFRDCFTGDDERIYRHKRPLPAGNAIFALSRYLKQQNWNPERWPDAAARIGISPPRVIGDITEFIRSWDCYKRNLGLLEHDDYVKLAFEAKVPPPAKVLYIDEFQDLSPSQVSLFKLWRMDPMLERIYVAGDPNQAIYGFRGASPTYLQAIAPSNPEFPLSHRCPSNIVAFADKILGAGSCMVPSKEGGDVRRISPRTDSELVDWIKGIHQEYRQVFILTRYQIHARRLSKILTKAGIPHSSITPGRITDWDKSPETPKSRSEIRVDTIHAAKGLEAIATVLYTGYLPGRIKGFFRSPDIQSEEQRVYYVGATRSLEVVYLLDDFKKNIPQAPVFRGIINTIPAAGVV